MKCKCYLNLKASLRATKGLHGGYKCPVHDKQEEDGMKQLNFFPYYKEILLSCLKTTTIRASNSLGFKSGEDALLTFGWNIEDAYFIRKVKIKEIYNKKIKDLNVYDFEGESSDCKTPESAIYVLGCIYRKVFTLDDSIFVIKFEHLED